MRGDRMAAETIILRATETASLHYQQPTQSFYNENPVVLWRNGYSEKDYLLIKFEKFPNSHLKYKYSTGYIVGYIESFTNNGHILSLFARSLPYDFDIKDRTYAADSDFVYGSGYSANIVSVGAIRNELPSREYAMPFIWDGASLYLSALYVSQVNQTVKVQFAAGAVDANRPYLEIYLDDPDINVSIEPKTGFIDEKEINTFSWDWTTNSIGGKSALSAQMVSLQWRDGAEGEITEIEIGSNINQYTFSANTFPNTTSLQWKISISFAEGYTAESDWATLTTIDATPTVEIISPKSVYIDGSIDNIFSWDYDISTGSAQYGAVLQYSDNNGLDWKNLGTVTGASTTYTVPANTLPAGTILWKVQATNSDGGTSEWSEPATVVVRSAPPVPVVSVSGASPRPIISWQALGQQAYQVQVGGYDSGEMYGTNKSYKVPEFLPDGPAIAKVRIQNSFGIWSEWGTAEFTVANVEIGSCVAKATWIKNWIRVSWDFVAEAERIATFYIYRDNALIGKTTESFFDDQLAWGAHAYKIRCAAGDYYAMSNEVKAKLDIKTACIAEYGVWDWLELPVVRGRLPALSTQYTGNVTYLHFAGRTLPVAEIGEERDVSWSFAFSTTNRECAERMASLFARLVVYKDPRDGACVGVLEGQSRQSDRYGWDFSYTLRAVDHKEVVTYDV